MRPRPAGPSQRPGELLQIVEDFERLWTIDWFAAPFAAELARPRPSQLPTEPHHLVLAEHHRLLVASLRHAVRRDEVPAGRNLDDLADCLVGVYLSRRLSQRRLGDWADAAITTILGA